METLQSDSLNSKEQLDSLRAQNEILKAQLMSTSLIHELTKVLHSCTDLESIIKTILLAIQEILEFDRVILFEIDRDEFCLRPGTSAGIPENQLKTFSVPLGFEGGEITDALFLNRHVLVEDPDDSADYFYRFLSSDSYLVIPLVSKLNKRCWESKGCTKTMCPAHSSFNPYCWSIIGSALLANANSEDERRQACIKCQCFKVEGVLWMDRVNRKAPITSDDITTLTAIVNLAGIVIENFRILNAFDKANTILQKANDMLKIVNRDLQVAQAKINSDLEHARNVQQGLLPQDLNDTEDFSLGAKYLSADAVGGDYYDAFSISEGVYGLVVADVSGHGVASALIMSMVKVLLKSIVLEEKSPQKTLELINQTFLSEIKTDNFVTIFYAVLDTNNHVLHYTSAGHCPVLLFNRQTRSCDIIKADGLFLGVFPDMMLSESKFEYIPGTVRLVLYTDGLTEAKNKKEEMYGLERLTQSASRSLDIPAKEAVSAILADQTTFCGDDQSPEDDITLLVIDF
jgi:serine phosphatase RsbU (regulator of sigma subunit)